MRRLNSSPSEKSNTAVFKSVVYPHIWITSLNTYYATSVPEKTAYTFPQLGPLHNFDIKPYITSTSHVSDPSISYTAVGIPLSDMPERYRDADRIFNCGKHHTWCWHLTWPYVKRTMGSNLVFDFIKQMGIGAKRGLMDRPKKGLMQNRWSVEKKKTSYRN